MRQNAISICRGPSIRPRASSISLAATPPIPRGVVNRTTPVSVAEVEGPRRAPLRAVKAEQAAEEAEAEDVEQLAPHLGRTSARRAPTRPLTTRPARGHSTPGGPATYSLPGARVVSTWVDSWPAPESGSAADRVAPRPGSTARGVSPARAPRASLTPLGSSKTLVLGTSWNASGIAPVPPPPCRVILEHAGNCRPRAGGSPSSGPTVAGGPAQALHWRAGSRPQPHPYRRNSLARYRTLRHLGSSGIF